MPKYYNSSQDIAIAICDMCGKKLGLNDTVTIIANNNINVFCSKDCARDWFAVSLIQEKLIDV